MPLDPAYRVMLDQWAAAAAGAPKLTEVPPAVGRAMFRAMIGSIEEPRVAREDRRIPGPGGDIPIRIYRPRAASGVLPIIVNFHGGGWVIGDLDTGDAPCIEMCLRVNAAVVSVDYRLAPEHRFPAAVDDAYAATLWATENAASFGGDRGRIAVAGDSAGGNLATVVAILGRDRRSLALRFQLLAYPVTDARFDTSSYLENADGYLLTRETMQWFWDQYAPSMADRQNPFASPLLTKDLRGLPPAFVMTAEFDPLRDEGEAYARRLREAGVSVELYRGAGMIHGFFSDARKIPAALPATEQACAALCRAFA